MFFLFLIFFGEKLFVLRFLTVESEEETEVFLEELKEFGFCFVSLSLMEMNDVLAHWLVLVYISCSLLFI